MNKLIGLKIEGLYINSTKNTLMLQTDFGDVYLNAVGDCCSQSWFEHISGVKNVIGGQITEEANLELVDCLKRVENDEFDVDKYYSTVIKTDKGALELEYRNNSNGYYGGWLAIDSDEYGDKIERDEDSTFSANFTQLKQDF